MNTIRQNILNILAYFDIFHYPVTNEEIRSFMHRELRQDMIDEHIEALVSEKKVYRLHSFYSLRNDLLLAERRIKGNKLALQEMKHAAKAAAILAKFPYVKGLAISGSLSKNFADEHTDVDFFIITAANRLWIARSFLQLLYKLAFLVGKRRWFCLNYYIDENGLEISEQNIFTAMEIVTLVPMHGAETLKNFMSANSWTNNFFPVHRPATNHIPGMPNGIFRNCMERFFNGKLGDRFDKWLMKITAGRWQKKMRLHKVNEKGIRIGMLTDRHFSKPDPTNFQHTIIEQYQHKVAQLALDKRVVTVIN